MRYAGVLGLMLVCGQAWAQPVPEGIHRENAGPPNLCGITAPTVDALRAEIAGRHPALPGNDRFLSFEDPGNRRLWNFTTPAHRAHPSAICREIVAENGQIGVRTQISCFSSREACDALYREFEELNAEMRRALEARTEN